MKQLGYNPTKSKIANLFLPDFMADSILEIDFKLLQAIGIKHVLIDVDQTVRIRYARDLAAGTMEVFQSAIKNKYIESVSLVTNNQGNMTRYSQPLKARVFQPFIKGGRYYRKPSREFFEKVLSELNIKPQHTVMIGDKIRPDVFGPNRVGIYSLLVKPIGSDYWFDQLLFTRFRDKRTLASAIKAYSKSVKK